MLGKYSSKLRWHIFVDFKGIEQVCGNGLQMSVSNLELCYYVTEVALLADVLNHLRVLTSERNLAEVPACSPHAESQEQHFNGETD